MHRFYVENYRIFSQKVFSLLDQAVLPHPCCVWLGSNTNPGGEPHIAVATIQYCTISLLKYVRGWQVILFKVPNKEKLDYLLKYFKIFST